MEISTNKLTGNCFKPFNLTFLIETNQEAKFFHALFNYSPICYLFRNKTGKEASLVREIIENEFKDVLNGYTIFWEEFLKYIKEGK